MKKISLGQNRIGGLFMRLVVPAVISQLIVLAYNIVDRIYIGHIPEIGRNALTGVGVCMPATVILSAFAQLVGFGGAPRASAFLGQQNKEMANRTLGTCAFFSLFLSVLLTACALSFSNPIIRLFGASIETESYAQMYFQIYVLGTVFVEIASGLAFFVTAQGYSNISMVSVLLGAGLNMVLDPIFIFGFGMGVRGAAIATVISQAVSCIWILSFLCGNRGVLKLQMRYFHLDKSMLLPALALGLSPFVQILTESLISVCFNRSLLKYGGDIAVGAMTIYATVMQFASLPITGIAQGAQPIISFNYGAGNRERVRKCCALVLKTAMAYSISLWLFIQLFPSVFPHIFADEPVFLSYSSTMIRTFFSMLWVMGAQISCQLMFVALGNAKVSLFLAILRKVFLLLPLIFLLPLFYPDQVRAVFLAEPIADTFACVFTVSCFSLYYRKNLLKQK